jgi:predicted Rossmann fold nucleotide-binding protein DprA/Smf involved in DNA uptake
MAFGVAIVGSRGFTDQALVSTALARMVATHEGVVVVSGGARGADTCGKRAAEAMGLQVYLYLPDWDRFGTSAGFRRNSQIVEAASVVLAFFAPGTRSRGTQDSVQKALELGRTVHVYHEGRWSDR